jgi:isoleucyl-tRNA synthetase
MPFTTDEAWGYLNFEKKEKSVHLAAWPEEKTCEAWLDEALDEKWLKLIALREAVLKRLEEKRQSGDIGSGLETKVKLSYGDGAFRKFLEGYKGILPYVFIVSQVELADGAAAGADLQLPVGIVIERADGKKCERCWNYSSTVGTDSGHPTICRRCIKAITG